MLPIAWLIYIYSLLQNYWNIFFCDDFQDFTTASSSPSVSSSLFRMSHYTDEPRFTIEQIDLLQRLRRTGMTKQEILHALDTLDRLDREHGDKFGRRTAYGGGGGGGGSTTGNSSNHGNNTTTSTSSFTSANVAASSSTATTATQTQYRGGLSPSPSNSYDTSPPPQAAVSSAVSLVGVSQNGRDGLTGVAPNGKLSPPRYPLNSARGYSFDAAEEELDIDDKVEELMRRDSGMVKEEIKAFLGNRRISQAVVAQVTGISQSRISHWLLQQGSDLSEQKKRAFYRWYQLEKTTPGATLNMRPAPMALEEVEWRQTPPPISCAPASFRLRRGSRFTWRKECLAVMESYFNENQYPDEAKREEIANACNAVIQKPGKKLSDVERVTSLKVYNWFANRRKEIKRRANIATILESHGIDVQSPGGHSNSDDIDGNDYSEQGCDVPYFEKRPLPRPFGFYRLEPSSPTQDDSTSHSDHQDPISLAVEMAAVNHTILALSRPGAVSGDIKTEALDDD
ncbi:homeobox-containing protein 1 isoform X2 [Conger conger]|uniref:homeobox-containing protein 1 isoform X2 n=1 Tax=Conger conger TaxID=82655 RepID=UPI002A5A84E4|nr:homeobox-containing protein 1 isoform X2 [Conger conger]